MKYIIVFVTLILQSGCARDKIRYAHYEYMEGFPFEYIVYADGRKRMYFKIANEGWHIDK